MVTLEIPPLHIPYRQAAQGKGNASCHLATSFQSFSKEGHRISTNPVSASNFLSSLCNPFAIVDNCLIQLILAPTDESGFYHTLEDSMNKRKLRITVV